MDAVEKYYDLAKGKAHCDYSFHVIVTDPTEVVIKEEIPRMVKFGVTSVEVGVRTHAINRLADLNHSFGRST